MPEDSARDYAKEMRSIMESERANPDYTIATARDRIVEKLRDGDRDLWFGWLDLAGPGTVWEALDRIDRGHRHQTKQQALRGRFAEAAAGHAAGDSTALLSFTAMPIRVGAGTMPLGQLGASQLLAAKAGYDQRANSERMMSAFLGALLKKVGKRTVGEVFPEEQLDRMWRSLVGTD